MIRHHVLFTFAHSVPHETRVETVQTMREFLASQSQAQAWQLDWDAGLSPGNASILLVVDFGTPDDFLAFQNSQSHQRTVRAIAPYLAGRAAIQISRP